MSSFMEVHGGCWHMKELPTPENFENQVKVNENFGVSRETSLAIYEALKTADCLPKGEIKELGGGLYCTEAHYGSQTTTIKYTLDGKPTENPKPLEPGTMQVSATYDDGVFTTRLVMEGKPEMVVVRKIVNGEIEQTKTCGGASFTDYEARG